MITTRTYDAGYKAAKAKYVEVLTDVMVMFEEIERNRNLPPFAHTQQQYVAMGRIVRKLLKEE